MTAPVWLTIAEASAHSGVPTRTLTRWCARKKGKLKHRVVYVGERPRIEVKQSDLDAYERPQMGGNKR